jgi:hypothetical protein
LADLVMFLHAQLLALARVSDRAPVRRTDLRPVSRLKRACDIRISRQGYAGALPMKRAALGVVLCVISAAMSWGRAPKTTVVPSAPSRLHRSRTATWMAVCCVFGACATLGGLQSRIRRRNRILEERLAAALAIALRRGDIDFAIAPTGTTRDIFAFEPDEPEESEPQLIPSRYRLLGYPMRGQAAWPMSAPEERPIVRVRLLGSAEPFNDQLFLGVPKALLLPALQDEVPGAGSQPQANPQ